MRWVCSALATTTVSRTRVIVVNSVLLIMLSGCANSDWNPKNWEKPHPKREQAIAAKKLQDRQRPITHAEATREAAEWAKLGVPR